MAPPGYQRANHGGCRPARPVRVPQNGGRDKGRCRWERGYVPRLCRRGRRRHPQTITNRGIFFCVFFFLVHVTIDVDVHVDGERDARSNVTGGWATREADRGSVSEGRPWVFLHMSETVHQRRPHRERSYPMLLWLGRSAIPTTRDRALSCSESLRSTGLGTSP